MTDTAWMLRELTLRGPRTTNQLIFDSLRSRGYGLTPHSRKADLRRAGHNVTCRRVPSHTGRPCWVYELVKEKAA